jgi:hypothetical protein
VTTKKLPACQLCDKPRDEHPDVVLDLDGPHLFVPTSPTEKLPACPVCAKPAKFVLAGSGVACSGGCWMAPSDPKTWRLLAEQAAKARAWDAMERSASDVPPMTTATSFAIIKTMRSYLAEERKRGGLESTEGGS